MPFKFNPTTGNLNISSSPAGSDTEIQFNDDGDFGASSDIRTGSLYLNPSNIPSGSGTRMMWLPTKKAFRVGYVTDGSWDSANIGDDSFGVGLNARASGEHSIALGNATLASANNSIAIGEQTIATGTGAIGVGYSSKAMGYQSIAVGGIASGNASTTLGLNSIALGNGAVAIKGIASGVSSVAVMSANVSGDYSFGIGANVRVTGDYTFAGGGYNTISGDTSFVYGISNKCIGEYCVVFGFQADAVQNNMFSYCANTIANNYDCNYRYGMFTAEIEAYDEVILYNNSSEALKIPTDFVGGVNIDIVVKDDNNCAYFKRMALIKNIGGTTSLVGSVQTIGTDIDPNTLVATITIYANNTDDTLEIAIENNTNHEIGVVAKCEILENGYTEPAAGS